MFNTRAPEKEKLAPERPAKAAKGLPSVFLRICQHCDTMLPFYPEIVCVCQQVFCLSGGGVHALIIAYSSMQQETTPAECSNKRRKPVVFAWCCKVHTTSEKLVAPALLPFFPVLTLTPPASDLPALTLKLINYNCVLQSGCCRCDQMYSAPKSTRQKPPPWQSTAPRPSKFTAFTEKNPFSLLASVRNSCHNTSVRSLCLVKDAPMSWCRGRADH